MDFEEWWESHRGTGGSRHTFAFDAWNFQAVKIADQQERIRRLAKSWRSLAGDPSDWATPGNETDTAIRTAGRATMIQCAEELEKLCEMKKS